MSPLEQLVDSWMREPEFHRIRRLPPYVFAEVNAMKARSRSAARDIIDLGMGNPDTPTPKHIVDKLVEAQSLWNAERQVEIVELRYFAGLEVEEVAELLALSPTTIKRESAMARAFLVTQLGS